MSNQKKNIYKAYSTITIFEIIDNNHNILNSF